MTAAKETRARRKKQNGPAETQVLGFLASTFLRYGDSEKARTLYALLVTLQPEDRKLRMSLGYASLKCGRAEEALAHLESAFAGRTDALETWEALLLERTLRTNGMIEESKNLMRRVIAAGSEA